MYRLRFIVLCIVGLSITSLSLWHIAYGQSNTGSPYDIPNNPGNYLTVVSNTEGNKQTLHLPIKELLFNVISHNDENGKLISLSLELKPELNNLYKDIGLFDKPRDTVFIYPSFTQAAYGKNGFYDYYNKKCDTTCLTVPIPAGINGIQASSIAGAWALKLLNYPYLTDEDVDKNPDILKQYERVIVLHNEYVTKKEFDAITSHPDVIFLYPNALYAEVKADYVNNTITLVHGHGYPNSTIRNGFGWKHDNSKYEYDVDCKNWYFYKTENYSMLNCYPEYKILHDEQLLRSLQYVDPSDLLADIDNWLRYPNDPASIPKLLDDYGIKGTHIPSWVASSAIKVENNKISQTEFSHLLRYLSDQNLLN
ncbi:MAG: hypothetical protein ACYC9R_00005 [Nitrosotalea sp.]